jgi:hypothetical protein
MTHINSINLTPKELTHPVYRVMSFTRFIELLQRQELTLVRPHMWEDPFENYLYSFMQKKHLGTYKGLSRYGEDLFAQCWTLHRETDAMWRIYSPDNDGVRVRTDFSRLYRALALKVGIRATIDSFIGKVQYLTKEEIRDIVSSCEFQRSVDRADTSKHIARCLLLKRKEFSHEKEIRLIHDCWDPNQTRKGTLFDIPIDPNRLFDSVTIDPRTEYARFMEMKTTIKAKGFVRPVYRSRLYSLDLD